MSRLQASWIVAVVALLTSCGAPGSDTTPPAEVSDLEAESHSIGGGMTLTWSDPADADFDHAEITYEPGGATPVSVAAGIGTKEFSDLAPGAYTLVVRTVDTSGNKSAGLWDYPPVVNPYSYADLTVGGGTERWPAWWSGFWYHDELQQYFGDFSRSNLWGENHLTIIVPSLSVGSYNVADAANLWYEDANGDHYSAWEGGAQGTSATVTITSHDSDGTIEGSFSGGLYCFDTEDSADVSGAFLSYEEE